MKNLKRNLAILGVGLAFLICGNAPAYTQTVEDKTVIERKTDDGIRASVYGMDYSLPKPAADDKLSEIRVVEIYKIPLEGG